MQLPSDQPTRHPLRPGFALAGLTLLLGFASAAWGAEEWRLTVGSATATPGQSIEIPITLTTGDTPVAAIAFTVTYDPARLILDADPSAGSKVEVPVPTEFTSSSWLSVAGNSIGITIYDGAAPIGTLPDGTLALLRFRVLPGAEGFAPVRIEMPSNVSASDDQGRKLSGRITGEGGVAIGLARPRLVTSISSLHFGSIPIGSRVEKTVVATNAGAAPLTLREVHLEGDPGFGTSFTTVRELAAGESISLPVWFTAARRGAFAARLRIESAELAPAGIELFAAGTDGEFFYDRHLVIPAVARFPGAEDSLWRSTLHLYNGGGVPAGARMSVIRAGGLAPLGPIEIRIEPASAMSWEDLIGGLFGEIDTGGALLIETSTSDLHARSTTYHLRQDGGQVPQSVPALELSRLFHSGEAAYLIGIERSSRRRTNITLMNLGSTHATLRAEIFDSNGVFLGSSELEIPPHRINSGVPLLERAGVLETSGLTIVVTATTENATFFAYASTVDQISGAPVFQSPR